MSNFSLSKLSSLSQALTPKEAVKVVIGYFIKQDRHEGNYENEIQTIVKSIRDENIREYNFYWGMYMNMQMMLLDYQTTSLRLQILDGNLSLFQYFLRISPVVMYVQRSSTSPVTSDLLPRFFQRQQILAMQSQKDVDILQLKDDEIKEIYTGICSSIRGFLQSLENYKELIVHVEGRIFDGMQIVDRSTLWKDIEDGTENIITTQNQTLAEITKNYELLAKPNALRFDDGKLFVLERPKGADESWVEKTYNQLISYAERDSGFSYKM